MAAIKLYGSPFSLHTGRVRSYFIKNGIDYREIAPISQHYEDHILPAAGGRRGMPTIDFVPETLAARDAINELLASENPAAGSVAQRFAGFANFEVKGEAMRAEAQPFRFYLLKRVQGEYEQLNESDRGDVTELLERCDMLPVMETKLTRDIGRDNNLEVWC